MRALFVVFLVMLLASCAMSQQANSPEAWLFADYWYFPGGVFQGLSFGYPSATSTPAAGPIVFNIPPGSGFFNAYIAGLLGQLGMPAALYGQPGPPHAGWMTTLAGIVDIDLSQTIPIWEGPLSSTSNIVGVGEFSFSSVLPGGSMVPFSSNSPPLGMNVTYQGYVADPTTPAGYRFTAAFHIMRQ